MMHLIFLGDWKQKRRNNAPRPISGRRGLTDTRTLFRQYVTAIPKARGQKVQWWQKTKIPLFLTSLGLAKATDNL